MSKIQTPLQPLFKKTIFPNGFTIISERQPQYRSISLGIWVKTGSRHENPLISGISHFLEHMLFKGTKNRSALQIAQEIDQVGGEFNAFTTREYTCFHLLLLKEDWELGINILFDILIHSQFNRNEIEKERNVILQEIAMTKESPEELTHDLFFEKIYKKQALGQPILGTNKTIKLLAQKDLISFFKAHYYPKKLLLALAGDISHASVIKKLRPLMHSHWQEEKNKKEIDKGNKPLFKAGSWWVKHQTEQMHLIWGVAGPKYGSKDRFAILLLNLHLGGGMSSSLFQEIREKRGLAYTIYSNLSPFTDSGVFSIYAATDIYQAHICLNLIEKCITGIQKKSFSKKEIEITKKSLKSTLLLSSDHVESRMLSIAKNELFLGQCISVQEACRRIDKITPEDVKKAAQTLFYNQPRAILILGPRPIGKIRLKKQKTFHI